QRKKSRQRCNRGVRMSALSTCTPSQPPAGTGTGPYNPYRHTSADRVTPARKNPSHPKAGGPGTKSKVLLQ
ncbi:Hypothetical predicted protein, partial [Marmota monax]